MAVEQGRVTGRVPQNPTETLTGGGYLALLRKNRNYRRIWLAQVVSLLGDWFSLVAVVTLMARYTGSAQALGTIIIVRMLPMLLLGPFSGVLADRFNRRDLMVVADLTRAVTVLGFLFVDSAADIWLIYVLTAVQFSLGTLFEPARSAMIPAVTQPEERVAANALGSLTWSTLLAVGAALGGLTSGLLGAEAAFLVDSVSFLASALLLVGLPRAAGQACDGECGQLRMLADLRAGFAYLKAHPPILGYALIKPLAALSGGALFSVVALQALQTYPVGKDGSISLGLLHLAIGVGSGIGPWLGSRLLRRMGENRSNLQVLISLGFVLYGVGYIIFSSATLLPFAWLVVALAELGGGGNWVFSTTLLQLSVGEQVRGRVFAVELALLTLFSMVSALLGGLLLDQLDVSVQAVGTGLGILQIGIGLLALVLALWAVPRYRARHATRTAEGASP